MRTSESTIHLKQAPDVVFEFLADLCNDPLWRPEIAAVRLVDGQPGHTGAKFVETVAWEGITAEVTLTVAQAEPATQLEIQAADPGYTSLWTYTFTAAGGGTDLLIRARIETTGPLRLVEPFMWGLITRWMEASYSNLGSAIESAAAK